eukprot:CAMPEP_0196675062 /NCGR_PEP_ID=MMETSP1090-20130531/3825_1 /TAXON_ID=37098 /ORGANISM="Isochrysis sp, Strain CCMP1244" /LENGTH=222 /DNA_ID=CAMNT_0042012869 /DNA_START=386 /DNA_END=1053 /DNA_ORIENTATION=+
MRKRAAGLWLGLTSAHMSVTSGITTKVAVTSASSHAPATAPGMSMIKGSTPSHASERAAAAEAKEDEDEQQQRDGHLERVVLEGESRAGRGSHLVDGEDAAGGQEGGEGGEAEQEADEVVHVAVADVVPDKVAGVVEPAHVPVGVLAVRVCLTGVLEALLAPSDDVRRRPRCDAGVGARDEAEEERRKTKQCERGPRERDAVLQLEPRRNQQQEERRKQQQQ